MAAVLAGATHPLLDDLSRGAIHSTQVLEVALYSVRAILPVLLFLWGFRLGSRLTGW
jgi:hypothetical protein